MKIYFNSQYAIRNEENCSYLVKKNMKEPRLSKEEYDKILPVTLLPPIVGYLIDRLAGNELNDAINSIHMDLDISKNSLYEFIRKIIDNEHFLRMKFQSTTVLLPPYLLTKNSNHGRIISLTDFHPLDNFIKKRPAFPLFISLMITSKCQTDCVYCYADKSRKDDLDIETILGVIDQAYTEGALYMNISGGDIFAMKEWRKVLKKLYKCNLQPFISTKIPLKEADIIFLKETGVERIQFSIDSFLSDEINLIVRRDKEYPEQVKNTFSLLKKYGILLELKSVITKYNSTLKSVRNTLEIFENFSDIIQSWNITPAFYSEFKGNYSNYQATDNALGNILELIAGVESPIPVIKRNLENKLHISKIPYMDDNDFVCKNRNCVANTYSMAIMSNGKSTLCEMMYYNQNFYTGDIKNSTIKEIWNSDLSLKFFAPKQNEIVNTENNPCFTCKLFEKCKTQNYKKICYVDVVKVFGPQRYDYPDPHCPKAPTHNPELLLY